MFGLDIDSAVRQHALDSFPEECCGVVTPDGYQPQANLSDKPGDHFKMDAAVLRDLDVLAYVHSHVETNEAPSEYDMRQQIATAKPWGIVATDGSRVSQPVWWGAGVPRQALVGRRFVHGIWDCYSLIRDYYAQKDIELPEVPRGDGWWWRGENLYRDLFPEAGFVRIDRSELQEGDVFLAQVAGSPVINHGGVLTGQNLILHHLQNQLSRRETGGHWVWKPSIVWLRHKSRL